MRRRALTGLLVAIIAAGVGLLLLQTGLLQRVENETVDARFKLRGERPSDDVVVIAIDEKTTAEIGERWPFSRTYHARVIDRLRKAGVRQVAYDVMFAEQTKPIPDNDLFYALLDMPGTVLATTEVDVDGKVWVLGHEKVVREAKARVGHATFAPDSDGTIRRMPYEADGVKAFPLVTAEQVTGRTISRTEFGNTKPYIDYQGPPQSLRYFSFVDVMKGRVPASALRGRVAVVGATAARLNDMHQSPIADEEEGSPVMPGPEMQANAIATALDDFPLRDAPQWLALLLIGICAVLAPLARMFLRIRFVVAAVLVVVVGLPAISLLAFEAGHVITLVSPLATLLLSAAAVLGLDAIQNARERRRTRDLFSRFVPDSVVAELIEQSGGTPLGGSRMDATVMFSDLRGFTTFAENRPADEVVTILNHYLSAMSAAILDEGGTVVSFMGDGIMAVFGSPIERPDHADAALRAARDMLGPRLQEVNRWLAARDLGPFAMGVGLNSGEVMSGNVGSERRLEYAAIGDTTNVAARLEGATKGVDGGLLLADSTWSRLTEGRERLVPHGTLSVAGREQDLVTWALAPTGTPVSGSGRSAGEAH